MSSLDQDISLTLASQILADAFAFDPLIGWWDRSAMRRQEMFGAIVDDVRKKPCCTLSGDPNRALAIYEFCDIGKQKHEVLRQAAHSMLFYRRFISFRDLPRLARASWVLANLMPSGPFLHLQYFVTNSIDRRKGHGVKLLEDIWDVAKSRALTIYLETGSIHSRLYFARRGFEVASQYDFPNGPRIWTMRSARSDEWQINSTH
jgi:GNAT superfamily N-acetyltransferase